MYSYLGLMVLGVVIAYNFYRVWCLSQYVGQLERLCWKLRPGYTTTLWYKYGIKEPRWAKFDSKGKSCVG